MQICQFSDYKHTNRNDIRFCETRCNDKNSLKSCKYQVTSYFEFQILFRYATAFFKYSEEGILRSTDYITANQYLREMGTRMIDTERITYIAFNSVNPFPMRMIQSKRAMYLEQVKVRHHMLNLP